MNGTTEAFARVKIDTLLKDAGSNLTDGASVLFEHALPDILRELGVHSGVQGRTVYPWCRHDSTQEPYTVSVLP